MLRGRGSFVELSGCVCLRRIVPTHLDVYGAQLRYKIYMFMGITGYYMNCCCLITGQHLRRVNLETTLSRPSSLWDDYCSLKPIVFDYGMAVWQVMEAWLLSLSTLSLLLKAQHVVSRTARRWKSGSLWLSRYALPLLLYPLRSAVHTLRMVVEKRNTWILTTSPCLYIKGAKYLHL